MDPFNAWDIRVVTDPNVINATAISIAGNMFSANYNITQDQIFEQAHCINNDTALGIPCGSQNEGLGIAHSSITVLKYNFTGSGSGLLFSVTYKVVGSGGYSPIQISSDQIANGVASTYVDHVTINGQYGSPQQPDFALSVNPSQVSIGQGLSGTTTITVSSIASFTGIVLLEPRTNETTLALSVQPSSLFLASGGSNSSTLTIQTSGSTPPTSYSIVIRATSGQKLRQASFAVGVTPAPYFVMGVSPGLLYIHEGDTSTTTVTVQSRFGFSGLVSLSAPITSPAGLQASFSSPTIMLESGQSANSTLTLTTPFSPLRFRYTINITGTSGSLSQKASLIIIPPLGEISLSLDHGSFQLKPGDSVNATITISTHDYLWGTVDLAASMIGGTVNLNSTSFAFGPVGQTTASFSMRLLMDSATVPGNYNLTLTVYTLCFTPTQQANNCAPGDKTLSHVQSFSVVVSSNQVSNRPSSLLIFGLTPFSYFGILGLFTAVFVVIAVQTFRKRRER